MIETRKIIQIGLSELIPMIKEISDSLKDIENKAALLSQRSCVIGLPCFGRFAYHIIIK